MSHWRQQVMFPQEWIDLQKELTLHPELCERLADPLVTADSFEIRMSIIANHCNIILDGEYDEKDFIHLAKIFKARLEDMRIAPSIQIIRSI